MPISPDPLLLGGLAFACGILALVSGVVSTAQERRRHAQLPEHQVQNSVDGSASLSLAVRSAASPEELASRIKGALDRPF